MAGGGFPRLPRPVTHSSERLLLVMAVMASGFYGVRASACPTDFHKKVGDSVQFPTCLPTHNLNFTRWMFELDEIPGSDKFRGRATVSEGNYSLSVVRLTLMDAGTYSFLSEQDGKQRETKIFKLHVHEDITDTLSLAVNSNWVASNGSCVVTVRCRSAADGQLAYRLIVGNVSHDGPSLQLTLTPQGGATPVSCSVSNPASETTQTELVTCRNGSVGATGAVRDAAGVVLPVVVGASLSVVLTVLVAVWVHCWKKQAAAGGSDTDDLTVYAVIPDTNARPLSSNPTSSIYASIDEKVGSAPRGTIYDTVQLNRLEQMPAPPSRDEQRHA